MHLRLLRPRASVAVSLVILAACSRAPQNETPVATPSVSISPVQAAIGTPIEMSYTFAIAPAAPAIAADDMVFVHFIDTDGELLWTDDHQPPTPTSEWKPGQTIRYTRTMFVPKFPYVGETRVEIGVYSPKTNERVPMTGETRGQRSYHVATFNLTKQTDNLYVVFKDGWQETETSPGESGVEWQWSKKDASLAFRNPMRDVTFYFQCDQPVPALAAPQHVELRIGANVFDMFDLPVGRKELRKVDLTKAQLGDAETVEVTVAVDKTFVPASITQLKSNDPRELGIRVFRAYVQPK
jgi:hypothetical protein